MIRKLQEAGHEVIMPNPDLLPMIDEYNFVRFDGDENESPSEIEQRFLETMCNSDIVVLGNYCGHKGFSATLEYGAAIETIELGEKSNSCY